MSRLRNGRLLAAVAGLLLGLVVLTGCAETGTGGSMGQTVSVSQLPPQARTTLHLIARGGPFPYSHDGIVFENREGMLPDEPYGYYHEYTVVTPGSPDRGARRIITAKNGTDYYTSDHYESFERITGLQGSQ